MRCLTLLVCAGVVGCASTNGSGVQTPPAPLETMRVEGHAGLTTVGMVHEASASGGVIPVSIDSAWMGLRRAYDSLGIPLAMIDPGDHVMGNQNVKIRRNLGNVPLSKYLNCGNTQGGPSADTYEISLALSTTLRKDAGGTMLLTTVDAAGRPVTLSGDYVHCSSTTALEARILDLVKGLVKS